MDIRASDGTAALAALRRSRPTGHDRLAGGEPVPEPGHRAPNLPTRLTEVSVAVYRRAVEHGRITVASVAVDLALAPADAAQACADLLSLKLLAEDEPEPGTLVRTDVDRAPDQGRDLVLNRFPVLIPVHPDVARRLWSGSLVDEIEARRHAIEVNDRQLRRISEVLATASVAVPAAEGVRVVHDPAEVEREIDLALLACSGEVVSTQPGGPLWDVHLRRSLRADLALLNRGVARRLLYQHTARANLGMRSYASRLAEHGGQVRTTAEGLERMLIFDRRAALVPLDPPGPEPSGAIVVTHPPLVRFLYRGFERVWLGATPCDGEEPAYDGVSAEIRASLLRLMAEGLKDDAIAHKLGMATRTCRRHLSAIMDELNATSRFQAGVKAVQLGMLPRGGDTVDAGRHQIDSYPWW